MPLSFITMGKILISIFFIVLSFTTIAVSQENYKFFSEISISQLNLVKTYTLKALNTSLEAYSKVKERKLQKAKLYIESALFFLNEATTYSPVYSIKKKIQTLAKRIDNFPDLYYKEDLISIVEDIKNFAPTIRFSESKIEKLNQLINSYDTSKNNQIKEYLKKLGEQVYMPLIDEPLNDAKTFLAMAYDNLKANKRKRVLKSIEIALDPMLNVAFKENLPLIMFKVSIYNSYLAYKNKNLALAKSYLQLSKKYAQKAYLVSSSEHKDMLKGLVNQLNFVENNFEKQEVILREYIIIIRQIRNL